MHTSVIELTSFGGLIITPYNHLQVVIMSPSITSRLIRIKPGPLEPFVIKMLSDLKGKSQPRSIVDDERKIFV
jgi:hypothetical protein